MENLEIANQGVDPLVGANTTTKEDLLRRAKEAIEDGEQSLHKAADALGLAQQDFNATQREIATAVGRSVSWVNRLLKWRLSGYKEHSPFEPTTTSGRVSHAKQRAASGASKPRRVSTGRGADNCDPKADAHDPVAGAARRKAEYEQDEAKAEADPEEAEAKTAEPVAATSAKALAEFRYAVDHWFPKMDDTTKRDAVAYAVARGQVETS